jgi:hypothetical protein
VRWGGVPPQYYFDMILPVIEADGLAAACELLTCFCLAAITIPEKGQPPMVQVGAPRPMVRHVPLHKQAEAILSGFLTGLRHIAAPEVNLQPLINMIMAGQEQRQHKQAVARLHQELKESTSVSLWLGIENFAHLLKYCRVREENKLAPLWGVLTKRRLRTG